MSTAGPSPLFAAALACAQWGWPVLPLHTPRSAGCSCIKGPECEHPGKHPRTLHGLKDASTDEAVIRQWWSRWQDANIGIAVPDGIVVVDVDGEEGETALREAGYELPPTVTCRTGRGTHHYYRTPAKVGPKVGLLPHVDLRGPGSYVVPPPSLHASGSLYSWIVSPTERKLADAPEWLLRLVAQPERGDGGPVEARATLREGERNDSLFRLGASVRAGGLSPEAVEAALLAENRARCSPQLPDAEVRVIAASASKYPAGTREGVTPPGPATRKLEVGEADALVREAGLLDLGDKPSPDAVDAALRRLTETPRLRELDALGMKAVQARATEALQAVNATHSSAMVRTAFAALEDSRKAEGKGDSFQGRGLDLKDPEPHPEPVDGAEMLDELRSELKRFLVLPPGADVAIALWVQHTHLLDAFDLSPILFITSPTRECGKTRVYDVIGPIVRRSQRTSNLTGAALFRTVERFSPAFLIDEGDLHSNAREDYMALFNAGHTRDGSQVIRTVGDDHEPRVFSVWAPKAMAAIGSKCLPDSTLSRCIIICMKKRRREEKITRWRSSYSKRLLPLGRKAFRWAQDNREAIRNALQDESGPEVPQLATDRAEDNWRPLLAIADRAGGEWPKLARQTAVALSGSRAEDLEGEPASVQLLADFRDLFARRGIDRLSSEEISDALASMEDRPWPEWRRGKPITPRQIAALLRPFGVRSGGVRIGEKTPRGYTLDSLRDAFSRYFPMVGESGRVHLPSDITSRSATPQQSNNDGPSGDSTRCNTDPPVAPPEFTEKPRQMGIVAPVALPKQQMHAEPQGALPLEPLGPENWEEI